MNASENKVEISGKEIIETDGAIIAGILILLTISSFSPFEFSNRSMFVSLIIPAIMLFSVSALYSIERKVVMGKDLQRQGYWLIGFMIFLMLVNILNVCLLPSGKIRLLKRLHPVVAHNKARA